MQIRECHDSEYYDAPHCVCLQECLFVPAGIGKERALIFHKVILYDI